MNHNKPLFAGNPYLKYKKGKQIGFGSYGTVFEAESNGIVYAIKKIHADIEDLDFTVREIEALIKLDGHPNIVKYYEIWFRNKENVSLQFGGAEYKVIGDKQAGFQIELNNGVTFTPEAIYIVMEHCNTTLYKLMSNRNLSRCQINEYFKGILDGLKWIADNRIVHRDLKPENIFLDRNGVIKIGDFGLAIDKESKNSSNLTKNRGTELYTPPEHLNSELIKVRNITAKRDIYSFGLIYYFMVLGTVPVFNTVNLIRKYGLCYKKPEIFALKDIELLNRMLATDPEKRISIQKLYEYVLNDTFLTEWNANVQIPNSVSPKQLCLTVSANKYKIIVTIDFLVAM
ncbi:CBL-interacting protein kinase 18-like protein [Leptotrombidium deliense]|uniref:non-specific serine/threonine protein kinase n=1 Tax=Leptotrombidium deliense TaxID=299467 RepID=A0A443S1R8_9ACAR|nr:CBL-interacting protein kinase 18-like protein [Leptotrombidium deliense]